MADSTAILHVDDDPSFGALTKSVLERESDRFVVETATGAEEGLELIGDRPPDCVVSDYNMPGMDGIAFLRAVRAEHPDLPFILFTGKGSEAVASDAISAGVTDYLQKEPGSEQYELLANRIHNAVRARREAQRADRQDQLMRLTEFAGDTGGFELDVDSGDLLLTDGTRRLVGLSDDADITLEEATALYHPDDQADVRRTVTRAAEAGEQTRGTWRLRTLDGDERLVDVTMVPATENDDVTTLRGAIHDVTERKQRERRFQALVEESNDIISIIDADGVFQYQSPSIERILGYDPTETIGDTAWEYVHPDDRADLIEAFERGVADPDANPVLEYRARHADGSWRWLEARGNNQLDNPAVEGYIVNSRDVTDRKERERELQRTRDLMSNMEQLAGIGAWEYDPDTGTPTNTVGMRRIYGVDPESSLSLDEAFEFFHPEDRESLRARFDACLDTGEPYQMDARITTAEGTQRWVTARGERVDGFGSDDVVRGYVRDITAEKSRERQLTELNQASQDLLTAETRQEVADIGVRAARDVLDLRANAVHLCADDDTLTPVAWTDDLTALLDEVPSLSVTDSIAGRVYRRGDPTVVEDARQEPDVHDPETDLRGHIYLPLADHGVLIASSEQKASFDQQDLAFGELLAGNLVAAFDRTDRERRDD